MAGRAAGAKRAGRGRLGVVLPSFLPLKSKSSAPGGTRAAAPGRLCCQPLRGGDRARRRTWASGAATPPSDTGRRRRPEQTIGGARPHLPLRLLGRWAAAGPRAWLALGRPLVVSQSGGRLQRRALGGRAFPPVDSECTARRRGDTPSPPEWPAPGERLSWRLHPGSPTHPMPRGSRLRRCARLRGGRPGLRLLPCLSTSNFRATSEQLKGRAETAGQGTPACPRASAAFASSRPPRPRLAAATSAVTSPEPIGIFCVASPPFV